MSFIIIFRIIQGIFERSMNILYSTVKGSWPWNQLNKQSFWSNVNKFTKKRQSFSIFQNQTSTSQCPFYLSTSIHVSTALSLALEHLAYFSLRMTPILNFLLESTMLSQSGMCFKQGSMNYLFTFWQLRGSHKNWWTSMRSSTDWAIGPSSDFIGSPPVNFPQQQFPSRLQRLWGFRAASPVNAAGILRLPPMSDPNPMGALLEATIPDSPPELPPHDLLVFQGFLQYPKMLLFVSIVLHPWGTLERTKGMKPIFLTITVKSPS